jgi:ribose 5-phosphate isomerase B
VSIADLKAGGQVLAFASDHGGLRLKDHLVGLARSWGLAVEDLGTDSEASVDYPDFAALVAEGVADGRFACGVLVCGTGLGMSMKANRTRGVRAAVCTSGYMARMARAHNDSNLLCLGERVIGPGEAEDILRTFLETKFEQGRHTRRIGKLDP